MSSSKPVFSTLLFFAVQEGKLDSGPASSASEVLDWLQMEDE